MDRDATSGTVIDLASMERERSRRASEADPDTTASSGDAATGLRAQGEADHDLLHRIALALNSTLELREVLRLLAEMVLETTGSDRCSLFLLEDGALQPAVAIGVEPDEDLWSAFQSMGPVAIERIPVTWEGLEAGTIVAIEDATDCELVPPEWVDRFTLKSLVLVPLVAAGKPCGVMAVDYQRHVEFDPAQLDLLGSIGSYAGVAIRNARLYEKTRRRAQLQEALAKGAAALTSPFQAAQVAESLADAYADLVGARFCGIGLLDTDLTVITPLAVRGTLPVTGPIPLSCVPERLVAPVVQRWQHEAVAIEFGDDPWFPENICPPSLETVSYLALPLVVDRRPRGVVLLGFDRHVRLDGEARSAAEALAAIAAAVLERVELLERLARHVRRFEILYTLSTSLTEGVDAEGVITRLNDLLAGYGVEVTGLVLRDRQLARRVGGEEPVREERAAWTRQGGGVAELEDGIRSVPMRLGRRVVGGLRIRATRLEDEERSFLETLARGVAEVVHRGILRTDLEEAARERAVGAERDRIAADLHDTAGQLFVAIGLLSRRAGGQVPAESPWRDKFVRVAELADRGKWEIDQAIRALAFVPAARRGLLVALRELARALESDSGLRIALDLRGAPARLQPPVERALYRIAHEALANAWRHARCAFVNIEVEYEPQAVVLRVQDDGVGVPASDRRVGIGISSMRRSIKEVNGTLTIRRVKPSGTLVEARVPRERR